MPLICMVVRGKGGGAHNYVHSLVGMHSDEEDLKAPGFGLKTYLRVPPPHVYETSPSVLT